MDTEVAAIEPSGFLRSRVVQVHPTLRCNLSCSHCYSSSSPNEQAELPANTLVARLRRLRTEGYDVVSFSGGEPLVYRHLGEVAMAARELGYRVNLITNGLLLHGRRLDGAARWASLIGVSIDGPEAIHDALRGAGTYRRTLRNLRALRERGLRFGIAHCVTHSSLPHLPDLLELCQEVGAALFQLHPLTLTGRAAATCREQDLGRADLARLFLMAEFFRIQVAGTVQLQLDVSPIEHALAHRSQYAVLGDGAHERSPLSSLVNPIVLDERGQLWPLAYGMDPSQRIAGAMLEDWPEEFDAYRHHGLKRLRGLLERAFDELTSDPDGFVDWYAFLVHQSQKTGSSRRRLPTFVSPLPDTRC